MYLSHFKLREKPFQLNTDPRFLWLGRQHREALATLQYGIQENKGLLLLTGDIGTGKTALIIALADRLADDNLVIAKLPDPGLVRNDFFFLVSHSFGIHHRVQDKETFTEAFENFLERTCERRQNALLIVDEAQIMSTEILEEVRLLSNMECRSTRLLNIILVGQNGFNQLLYRPENRAIRKRITISYNLQPLTEAETEAYIAHRLKIAGAKTKFFTDGAVHEIHAFSSGSPRQINIICDLALVLGFAKNTTKIDSRTITACKERMRIPNMSGPPLPDEYLPARVDSPSKTIILTDSPPAGDRPKPHPPGSEALPIPAVPHQTVQPHKISHPSGAADFCAGQLSSVLGLKSWPVPGKALGSENESGPRRATGPESDGLVSPPGAATTVFVFRRGENSSLREGLRKVPGKGNTNR